MRYILFDTALNGLYSLLALQQKYQRHQSLFKDTPDASLIESAPYLFEIDDELSVRMQEVPELSLNGLIVVESGQSLESLASHLQGYIYQTIKGREYYFRFWDGRVLRKFLPTCEEIQLRLFFGQIKSFSMLDEDPAFALQYSLERYKLQIKKDLAGSVSEIFLTTFVPLKQS